jgi:hypothetical protein
MALQSNRRFGHVEEGKSAPPSCLIAPSWVGDVEATNSLSRGAGGADRKPGRNAHGGESRGGLDAVERR